MEEPRAGLDRKALCGEEVVDVGGTEGCQVRLARCCHGCADCLPNSSVLVCLCPLRWDGAVNGLSIAFWTCFFLGAVLLGFGAACKEGTLGCSSCCGAACSSALLVIGAVMLAPAPMLLFIGCCCSDDY